MKPIYKFLFILAAVGLIVMTLASITAPYIGDETRPERIPTYSEAVPRDFQSPIISNVLDVRDTSELMEPRLPIVKVADNIIAVSCPTKNDICMVQSLLSFVRNEIEHQDALLARDFILSPEETILYRQGDSLTQSVLLSALLRAEGFDTRLASTPYVQFVEVSLNNQTVRLDPGCASCTLNQTRYNGPNANIVYVQ